MIKNKIIFYAVIMLSITMFIKLYNVFSMPVFAQSCAASTTDTCIQKYCKWNRGEELYDLGFYTCGKRTLSQTVACYNITDPSLGGPSCFYIGMAQNSPGATCTISSNLQDCSPPYPNCSIGSCPFCPVSSGSCWISGGGSCTVPSGTGCGSQGCCSDQGGSCINSSCSSCDGNLLTGYCHGSSSIRCCVPNTPTPTPPPACLALNASCSSSDQCCSSTCSGSRCCKPNGASCGGAGGGCCSGYCNGTSCDDSPTPIPPTAIPPTAVPPTATPTPTNTPTPTPSPTPIPEPWYKLKDSSYVGISSINDPIPLSPVAYDSDDSGIRQLIDGANPGVVSGQSINIAGAPVSSKGWKVTGLNYPKQFTVQKFIEYVRTKKSQLVNEITSINNAQSGKINILTGSPTLTEGQLSSIRPFVLIVIGNVTFSSVSINPLPPNKLQVIMSTGTISFSTSIREANGLYIADSLDFGTTANQGIKIIGNIIAQSSFSNARQWSNAKRPGLFIVFDPSHYIGLLNMLSTITYDWRQIQ